MLWENLRSEEFKEAVQKCNEVCVIPIGCLEAHGVHLPLGCDTLTCREIAVRAAKREPVCIFPAMYFGEKSGAGEYPGTVIFPLPLIMQILEQCCKEIGRNGFKKIVLLNGHGGNNSMLNTVIQNILQSKPNYIVYRYYQDPATVTEILPEIEKYPYLTQEDIHIMQTLVEEKKQDAHGGFSETGVLYDICPELIRLDRMDALDGKNTERFKEFVNRGIYTPFYWMGNCPHSLNMEMHYGLNERIARALAAKTVENTTNIFNFLREETISTEFHKEWLAKQV